jgi:D-tyrosyl-tRNA(Tyr) deacylase
VKALIQRVTSANVTVNDEIIGEISNGWLVLLGVGRHDDGSEIQKLAEKILGLRLFSDHDGKFNLSVQDIGGSILVVSQFTLYADASRGRRPGFSEAAPPDLAKKLYERFIGVLRDAGISVATGSFGADMKVSLVNDGPVTVMLDSANILSGKRKIR